MSQLIGPGKHPVTVVNAKFVGEDPNGQAQLSVYFEDDCGDHISWYTSLGTLKDGGFSEKALKFACDQLKNLGWDAEREQYAFERLGEENSPLIGRTCEIVVAEETYEGKTRTKVKWINDPSRAPGVERMAPEAARTFADRIRSHLGVKSPPKTSRTPPARQTFPKATLDKAKAEGVGSADDEWANQF